MKNPLAGRSYPRPRHILCLLAAISLPATSSLWADVKFGFQPTNTVGPENSELVMDTSIIEDPAKPGTYVWEVKWPAHSGTHIGANLLTPPKLPILFDSPGRYKITATVNLQQVGRECPKLALRVLDGSGNETFNIASPLKGQKSSGWREVSWEINTRNFKPDGKSWGLKVDGVLDLPVHFLGFAVGFTGYKTPGGTLLISQVECTRIGGTPGE